VVQIVVNFAFYLVLVGLFPYYERVAAEEAVEGKRIVDDEGVSVALSSSFSPNKIAAVDDGVPSSTDPAPASSTSPSSRPSWSSSSACLRNSPLPPRCPC